MAQTFTEVRLTLIRQGAKPWIDPDYREVMKENPEILRCNSCGSYRQLRGFKRPGECRMFAHCPECGRWEEI
jgi:hypothetical protein